MQLAGGSEAECPRHNLLDAQEVSGSPRIATEAGVDLEKKIQALFNTIYWIACTNEVFLCHAFSLNHSSERCERLNFQESHRSVI